MDEIRRPSSRADSLAYIERRGTLKAAITVDAGFCDACFTGDYPTAVPAAPTSTPVVLTTAELSSVYQAALPGV